MMIHAIGPHTPGIRIRRYYCFLFFLVRPELGSGLDPVGDAFRAKASVTSHFFCVYVGRVSGFATRLAHPDPPLVHALGTLLVVMYSTW